MGREKPGKPRRTRVGDHVLEGGGVYVQPTHRRRLTDPGRGLHLWVATAAFRLSDEEARRGMIPGQEKVLLDQENLAEFGIGCFKCEEPRTDELAARPCSGSMDLL